MTVTDNLGCVDSVELTLATESDLNFQTTTKNPTCEAADDGEISATIGAAQGPYDFELNAVSPTTSTATSAMWDNLDTGDYIMIVEDSTGNCVARDTIDLFAPVPWNDYNIIQYDSITCYNDMDASIVVQGTTTGVTFTWSDGGTGLTRTGLDAGTYELWLTTAQGCQDTLSATYTQPNEIIPTWSSTTTSCPEVDDGTITFTATGGNGTLNFQIDGNPITPGVQTGIGDGTYTFWVWVILEGVGKPPLWSSLQIQAGTITALLPLQIQPVQTTATEP